MTKLNLAKLILGTSIAALGACGGGGSSGDAPTAAPTPYLKVSVDEFYFGTRTVGTRATQAIELANQSADIYPIRRLALTGANAEEFALNFGGEITLNPSEKISVDVSFNPITEGLKNASIMVDYDILAQGTAADNLNEQLYYEAANLEQQRQYALSRSRYKNYIQSDPVTPNAKRAAIKLPVLDESQKYGEGPDFTRYVDALNARDDGDFDTALTTLDGLLEGYPESYLADDALYLKSYIKLIDQEKYAEAQLDLALLQQQFPESSYTDTAIYSEALALEKSGEHERATSKYESLLERHRSNTWSALNLNVAKDNLNSRMWFNRANQGLERLDS